MDIIIPLSQSESFQVIGAGMEIPISILRQQSTQGTLPGMCKRCISPVLCQACAHTNTEEPTEHTRYVPPS